MAKATKRPDAAPKKVGPKKAGPKKGAPKKKRIVAAPTEAPAQPIGQGAVLERLWHVVESRRSADPAVSHSARLLARGTAKIAQKFGEEAVECLIEATLGNHTALIAESADVLYHLIVLWVDAGVRPEDVWEELHRREGISGIAEKASRARRLSMAFGLGTRKIP
jgi:phosphoribosyl-ATP pyrophosphohydrolase